MPHLRRVAVARIGGGAGIARGRCCIAGEINASRWGCQSRTGLIPAHGEPLGGDDPDAIAGRERADHLAAENAGTSAPPPPLTVIAVPAGMNVSTPVSS